MIEGLEQKNISLDKGIVRTPSLGQEGELSECVNLIPHAGEMVRIHEPQPLTEDVTGQYLYYTFVWERVEGGGSFIYTALSGYEDLRHSCSLSITYRHSQDRTEQTEKFDISTDRMVNDFEIDNLTSLEDIVSIELGDKDFMQSLPEIGYVGLKAYRLFEFATPNDITFPTEEEQANMPIELQPGELLLETNRCAGKENLIVRNGNTLVYYRPGEGRKLLAIVDADDFKLSTLGQTIVISHGLVKRFFVWGDKGYAEQDILTCVPEVEFTLGEPIRNLLNYAGIRNLDGEGSPESYVSNSIGGGFQATYYATHSEDHLDGSIHRAAYTYLEDITEESIEKILGQYAQIRAFWKDQGYVCSPFYVRYGVELYDGSVINLSPPILITPSSLVRPYFGLYMPLPEYNEGGTLTANVTITPILNPRALFVHINAEAMKSIDEELVKGVVVYATPEIEPMDVSFKWDSVVVSSTQKEIEFRPVESFTDGLGTPVNSLRVIAGNGSWNEQFDHESLGYYNYIWLPPAKEDIGIDVKRFTDPSEFYLLASLSYAELRDANFKVIATVGNGIYKEQYPPAHASEGETGATPRIQRDEEYMILSRLGNNMHLLDPKSLSILSSQKSLSKVLIGQSASMIAESKTTYEYNARLIFGNFIEKDNIPDLASNYISDCRIREIRDQSRNDWSMAVKIGDRYKTITPGQDFYKDFASCLAYIALPGKQGKAVAFNTVAGTFEMTLSKALDSVGDVVSWCKITPEWLRTRVDLQELYPPVRSIGPEWWADNYEENGTNPSTNKIAVTRVANPWVIESIQELSCGEIYAITSATEALSEGQFGEFPMYAFTDRGVYALEVSAEGGITAKQPICREVLYNKNAPLQIDKAVVFPTPGGLKLISGRSVSHISSEAEGLNIDEGQYDVSELLKMKDTLPFQKQLESAMLVYDYASKYTHLFNTSEAIPLKEFRNSWASEEKLHTQENTEEGEVILYNTALPHGLALNYRYPPEDGEVTHEYIILALSNSTSADLNLGVIVPLKKGEVFTIRQGLTPTSLFLKSYISHEPFIVGDSYMPSIGNMEVNKAYSYDRDCYIGFKDTEAPAEWTIQTTGTITTSFSYFTQKVSPITEEAYRQKHYVYDLESGQWATQILDRQLTTCVAGYPFSTMQFGRQLMQYNNELEADIVKQGWLLTRPISFNDPFTRKMLADIRLMGQKTHADTKFKVQVYISEDRVKWHRLTSLKGRSAKWYRFLIKADMCGLDTLTGISCQYVPRLGNKLR